MTTPERTRTDSNGSTTSSWNADTSGKDTSGSQGGQDSPEGMSAVIDEQKGRVATKLRDIAGLAREHAGDASIPGFDRAAEAAAKPLETGAAYIEEHTPGDMWSDLMTFCHDHPAGALSIGFIVGYLFKKLFR